VTPHQAESPQGSGASQKLFGPTQAVFKLPALWDLSVMPQALNQCLEDFDRLLKDGQSGEAILVDLSSLERFDSCGLAALLELQRRAKACGRPLHWHAMSENMQELARVYGLTAWFVESQPQAQGT
jgi:phospholipid transport system transporter-binding protein